MTPEQIVVVGTGRVGLSLGRALLRSGRAVSMLGRRARPLPDPLGVVATAWGPAVSAADLVMIAVADDAIAAVAAALARDGAVTGRHVILHTSGLHDRAVLAPLQRSGAALGSWHPLQTFARAEGEPEAFAGAPAVIEGDARALLAGRTLAGWLHMRPVVELDGRQKAVYHAGGVFAANYLVVLADVASRLARQAGAGDAADHLFDALMRHALGNYIAGGAATLTGPIRRGDAGTVARHLGVLGEPERSLYIGLGREALRLAVASGLDAEKAKAIDQLLY